MGVEFEVKDLTVIYGLNKNPAIRDLNVSFEKGSFNVILGPNGSGKSTLLRCLGGYQNWTSGTIFKNGESRDLDLKDFNKDQILVSEDIVLPQFKLDQLAKIYEQFWPAFDYDLFSKVLSYGEISINKTHIKLSRGQKILCQFALGLASGVQTLLVDEVTAALDPYTRRKIIQELNLKHKNRHATIILATNIVSEIQHLDVNLLLMKQGQLYLNGQYSKIKQDFIKIKITDEQSNSLRGRFIELSSNPDGSVNVLGKKSEALEFKVEEASFPTMEEIFIYLSNEGKR